jgi:glycosyltransferase
MRVLFSSLATAQHLYPLVPLAWACRAAGHEVRVAGAPWVADLAVRTGLPAVAVGHDIPPAGVRVSGLAARYYSHEPFPEDWPLHQHLLNDDQRNLVEQLGRNCAVSAEAIVDDLIAFGRIWEPDLIVHDLANLAGPVAASALGVPNVRHLTGVGLRPMERQVPGPELLPEYVGLFERRGLAVRETPTLSVDPSPPGMQLPVDGPCLEMRYVPYNGAGMTPDWLNDPVDRPRVCVTWGYSALRASLGMGRAAFDACREAIDALAELDVEIVLVTSAEQLELLGDLPSSVRPSLSTPLHLVLSHCDLVVHQAGDGTALTSAAAGIPQLTITQKPDPALTSDRLAAKGAGVHLRYQHLQQDPARREVIRTAAAKLLVDLEARSAAERLREEMRGQPSPAALVPALVALAKHGLTQEISTKDAQTEEGRR